MEINTEHIQTMIQTIKAQHERNRKEGEGQKSFLSDDRQIEVITSRKAPLIGYFTPINVTEYDSYGQPKQLNQ